MEVGQNPTFNAQPQKLGVLAEAVWDAASRKIFDLRLMVSDDRVALSTLDEVYTLLLEWRRAAEHAVEHWSNSSETGLASERTARPHSARSKLGNATCRFGQDVRPYFTPSHTTSIDGTSHRVQDYASRVSASASTVADSIGIWRAVNRTASHAAAGRSAARGSPRNHCVQPRAASHARDGVPFLNIAEKFDFVTLEPDSQQVSARPEVIRVDVQPLRKWRPTQAAASKILRPVSARMASSRDSARPGHFITRAECATSSVQMPSRQCNQRPLSSRLALRESEAVNVCQWDSMEISPSQRSSAVPTDLLYDHSNFNDHLRWLNAATCAELVDAVCRRPHQDLGPYAKRLQDHLQIFTIYQRTFNSRDELERQHTTIDRLHEDCHKLTDNLSRMADELSRVQQEADSLRQALALTRASPTRVKSSDSTFSSGSGNNIGRTSSGEDDHVEKENKGTIFEGHSGMQDQSDETIPPHRILKSIKSTCDRSEGETKKHRLEKEQNEQAVKDANTEYAKMPGVREALFSDVEAFYKGLDRFNGMPVAAGELDFFKMMEYEFCGGEDADVEFVTYNYGGLRTTLRQEWEYVVNPQANKEYAGLRPHLDQNHKPFPKRDNGHVHKLEEFLDHAICKRAGLRKSEVIGLRLQTGPVYMHLNGTLRSAGAKHGEHKRRFTVTISMVNSAIRKLVRVTPINKSGKLYRGISKMAMPSQFFERDDKNCRGFVEPGFTSTTTDRAVAISYAGVEEPSILEISTGQVDRGADLTWISQFPGEKEMLILPLSNFEVISMRRENNVNIFECGLNLNLNSKTMEDLLEARKISVVDFGRCLWNEARLLVNTPPVDPDLLPDCFSEERLLDDVCSKEQEYFNDTSCFHLSLNNLFEKWRDMMHQSAKRMKDRAEWQLKPVAQDLFEDEDHNETSESQLQAQKNVDFEQVRQSKRLLLRAEKVLERTTSANDPSQQASNGRSHLYDIQTRLLPFTLELEAGGENTMELATALMTKTSKMIQASGAGDDTDKQDAILESLLEAVNVRSEAFCTTKLNKQQAKKLMKTLMEVTDGKCEDLDLVSWVWMNDAFWSSASGKGNKKELKENLEMVKQLHRFGLRSLEDAVLYLKKDDMARIKLDSKRQLIINQELEDCRQRVSRKKDVESKDQSRQKAYDDWLKKKREEERAMKKKAKDMKAAPPKKNVISLTEELATFKSSDKGQAWRDDRNKL